MYSKLLPVVILLLFISSCKQGENKNQKDGGLFPGNEKNNNGAPPAPMEDHTGNNSFSENKTSSENSYDISAPDGWEKRDTSYMGSHTIMLFSPVEGDYDNFRENLNVVTERSGSMPLEQYFDISQKNIVKMLSGVEVIDDGRSTINGINSRWMHYIHNYQGTPLEVKAWLLVNNGTAYVLTSTCKKGDMDKWADKFEEAANSFRVN